MAKIVAPRRSFMSKQIPIQIRAILAQKGTNNNSNICFGANWEPPGGLRGLQNPSGGLPEASGERFSSPEYYKTA